MAAYETWMGYTAGIAFGLALVPIAIWFSRLKTMVKETHTMHLDPDKHGFGTNRTNELLEKHMRQENDMHQATIHIMEQLDKTIDRLAQFIEKLIEVQTGMPVPPPRKR